MKNEPNFEQPDRGQEGQLRKTKPNLGRIGHLEDGAPGGAYCAKQSQFLQEQNRS